MRKLRIIIAAVLTALSYGSIARAEPRVVAHHGNWDVSCSVSDGKPSPGACMLLIELGEGPDLRSVAVDRRDGGRLFMRLTFVFGVYLPRGVDLAFDGQKRSTLKFERCVPQDGGCIAELDAAPVLDRLKAGGVMTLAFKPEANGASNSNVSINGFAEALAALDALTPPAATPNASGNTVASYGAWQMFCRDNPDVPHVRGCDIVQSAKDEAANSALTAIFKIRPGKEPFLQMSVNGEILIGPGLAAAIDGAPQGIVPFVVCGQLGCAAGADLADIVLTRFKTGKMATFTYKVEPDRTVAIPLTLDGLDAALKAFADGG